MTSGGRRTLRRTLVLSAIVVGGVAAAVVVGAIALVSSQRDALERDAELLRTEQRIAEQIVALTLGQQIDAYRYLERGGGPYLATFRDRGERAYGQIHQYLVHELSPESRLEVEQIKEAHERFEVAAFRAFDLMAHGQALAARRRLTDLDAQAALLGDAVDRFLETRATQRLRSRLAHEASARRARAGLAVAATALFALVILLGLRLRQRVLRPLDDLMAAARRLGAGELDARVPAQRYLEFNDVAAGFNHMADNVQAARETMKGQNEEILETLDHLHETQAELVQREKLSAMGQMLAGLAHELNNPLAGVLGMAELLHSELEASPDVEMRRMARTLAEPLEREALRARSLVRNLLTFARRPSGVVEPIYLFAAVNTAMGLSAHAFAQAHKTLRVEIKPNLLVLADAQKLQHAIVNVVNNALDAVIAADGTGMTISAAPDDQGMIRVDFDDDGTGFEDPEAALVAFYTTKAAGKGTGLGLSLVEQFVNEIGGRVMVSNREDGGARVSLLLRAASDADAQAAATAADATGGVRDTHPAVDLTAAHESSIPSTPGQNGTDPTTRRPRVLVVDDEPTLRSVQSRMLTRAGIDVVVAASAEEAREVLVREQFDLVISDLRMPGESDGRELLDWLKREHPELAERSLLITGDVGGGASAPLPVPMDRVLPKPFSSAEYLQRVRLALGQTDN